MDSSRIGLDFIVENPEYIRKLAAALDTNNVVVKKQVFELLSALCVHNEEGHARALDTLDQYKKLKNERYRLSIIVKELDRATVVQYQTALVAFINCLIISTPRLTDRTRLRNEFIGCHLLPVLNNLRKCAEAEPELAVQLDVFDEQKESDDAQCLQGPHGVDLNSPLDVFYAILKQVAETPQEVPFLSILQHLLRIDSREPVSDVIWDTAERLIHRATLLENRDDATRLLRTPSISRIFCHCQHKIDSGSRKQSLTSSTPLSPTPGPPPPPPFGPSQPPPPPPPPSIPTPPSAPPPAPAFFPPPPPQHRVPTPSSAQAEQESVIEKLPQQEIPVPKIKMKTINWNKIPSNKVVGKNNIWTQVAYRHQHSPLADMDWSEMEGLFCQQAPPSAHSSPKLGNRESAGTDSVERRVRKDTTEITLLDGKRSLNVNIFLKQFRSSNEDIIELIKNGDHDDIGTEKLKGLLKILPEVDELDMLKSFNGDFNKLGNAEKFLIQLTSLSNYKLRIESMLVKEEFASNMSYLEPSINSMIIAAQDLMTNKPLQEVLYMVIIAGNFLNSGGYAGDAAGVKLSSLQKITDIRANKPNMNLIHFVALQAEKKNRQLLSFTDNISVLEDAAKTTVEQLHNEINALDVRIKKVKKQIDLPTTEPEIKHQMTDFLHMAEREVANLQKELVNLENVRKQLADFFCEDSNSFKIEECFRVFHGFYCKFRQAIAENERRRLQEEQANARRKQREELLATKRKQMETLSNTIDSEGPFIEMQIYDTRACYAAKKNRKYGNGSGMSEDEVSLTGSPSLSRRRLGSFNGNGGSDSIIGAKDEKSPDITPNGSLRRRRSRVLSEEDEGNLMDFLRASGNDTNRERKSWGSLDRSWARKARGSGPRKRPALLSADFSSDRERPSSPSPLTENKPILSAPEEDTQKPKEWRQKIESWLQANENDVVSDEQRRQNRRLTNRRSLEMDSESERSLTLDTLPEGKQVYSGSQSNYRKVYPPWQPSSALDNTDVVRVMETVEDVQPHQIKDKSAWRKSNLNVSNSTEETTSDTVRGRHTLPRTNRADPLHSIQEDSRSKVQPEDDRKGLISSLGERPPTDRLTLYIRKPNDTSNLSDSNGNNGRPERKSNLGYIPTSTRASQQSLDSTTSNNKVEIDQDNIETPPATRRVFTPTPVDRREPVQPSPCKRIMAARNREDELENGDGQFDRFSAARRTRRYKRNTEPSETPSPTEPNSNPTESQSSTKMELSSPVAMETEEEKESRLKGWQEKLKSQPVVDNVESNISFTNRFGSRRLRNQTRINQDEVELALNNSKTIPNNISTTYIQPHIPKVESNKIDIPSSPLHHQKTKEQHDNDEGFEETQSLMSESPSQGASSGGGNYETDNVDSSRIVVTHFSDLMKNKPKPMRTISVESGKCGLTESSTSGETSVTAAPSLLRSARSTSTSMRLKPTSVTPTQNRYGGRIERSSSLKEKDKGRSVIPRRSDSISIRKSNSKSNIIPEKPNTSGSIQKSNSRNSIVSSRSSLNSAISTSTVKRFPLKPANNNTSVSAISQKPVIRKTSNVSLTSGNGNGKSLVRRTPSITNGNNVNLASLATSSNARPPRPQAMSFMKPTTSSSTKSNLANVRSSGSSFRGKF